MHSKKTKIAVLGAGSIGCFLGGLLRANGCEVVFIGRERLKSAVFQNGLTLTHFARPSIYLSPEDITISTDPTALSDCDLILLCTKSQDTAIAAQQIAENAKLTSHIVSCQNGISNGPLLRDLLKDRVGRISGAIVPFNVTQTGPAAYHCGTGGAFHIEHDLPEDVIVAFAAADQSVKCGGNFIGDQWAKLLVNLNNALNTLSGGTLRDGLMQKSYRQALALIVEEALSVAQAQNIDVGDFNGRNPTMLIKTLRLPNWIYGLVMNIIVKIDKKARSSMLDDLEAGRVSEIDYLQGEIVRQAKAAHMTASYNATILKAVLETFETGQSPKLSGEEILSLVKTRE